MERGAVNLHPGCRDGVLTATCRGDSYKNLARNFPTADAR